MVEAVIRRIGALGNPFVAPDVVTALYGWDWPHSDVVAGLTGWQAHYWPGVPAFSGDRVNRFALEAYLDFRGVVPLKVAGARLGMDEHSMRTTLDRMALWGIEIKPEYLVPEGLLDRFSALFDGTQHTIFRNHTSYCQALHRSIRNELGFEVVPLPDPDARAAGKDDLANGFDILTDRPLCIRYELLLEFGKPIHLRPDVCSVALLQNVDVADAVRERMMDGQDAVAVPPELVR